jgi:DNA modification methylase
MAKKSSSSTAATPARTIRQLADLTPDPQNPNRGTVRGQRLLEESLKTYGAGRSILSDRLGVVIAGNKTFEEAKALGLPVRVVETDGKELVVVQRMNLDLTTDPTARQLAIADNRIAELNLEWDSELLAGFAAHGISLEDLWTPQELEHLIGPRGADGHTPEDAVVPIADTTIQPGDLFDLGRHRLLCGDATDAAAVARVMGELSPTILITDPPYGVEYDPAWRVRAGRRGRHAVGPVPNDDRADWGAAFALFTGHVAYVWHAGLHAGEVAASLVDAGFELRAQIIWVKPHFVLGRGDFHWQHEPAWYAVRAGQSSGWSGDRTQSTVWSIPNMNPFSGGHDAENPVTGHSTQKPVALYERALLCNSAPGDVLFDPFLGSGTALIAAEKTGRRCLGLELEPRYVQAAISRWEAYTGQTARKVDTNVDESQG